ncbi:unnamed protein product [Amoebophrya sp. A25]|nr:unnamed protein product [Amoebophrya sp. A25]|eukprot:GSA25T00004593001.1
MSGAERRDALAFLGLTGLNREPTADDLKQAFRQKAKDYHPDRAHNHARQDHAAELFKKAKSCYDKLLDDCSSKSGPGSGTPTTAAHAGQSRASYSMNPNRGNQGFKI